MNRQYAFSLWLEVNDENQLLAAARAHPDAAAMAPDEFLTDAGDIDIKACLVMLLDPGSLPGVEIHESGAEPLEAHDVDFGEERN